MLQFQRFNLFLGLFGNHTFAMQFPVRTGMRLITGRQQVCRDIPLGGDIGNHFNFFIYIWQFGEKLSRGIAFQNLASQRMTLFMGVCQTGSICLI